MSMMESLLQGAAGAGAPGPQMDPAMGQSMDQPVEEPAAVEEDQTSILQRVIDDLIKAHSNEPDPEEAATLSKIEAQVRALIAKRAKESDTAMGIGPKEKHMRRALRG